MDPGPDRAERVARWLGRTLIAGCLAAAVVTAGWVGRRLGSPRTASAPAAARPDAATLVVLQQAHPGWPPAEIERLMIESWMRPFTYEPFTQFAEGSLRGHYVNVDAAGFRWSSDQCAWPPSASAGAVFVFGGSTTFGYGLPDAETIASLLQDALRAGRPATSVCVYNFGRGWFYSSQEVVLFDRLLVAGFVPRLAVFVDGLNDFLYLEDAPRFTEQLGRFMAAVNAYLQPGLRESPLPQPRPEDLGPGRVSVARSSAARTATPAALLERYARNRRAATAVARAFGAATAFVWQPVPFYRLDLTRHPFRGQVAAVPWGSRVRAGYELMAARRATLAAAPRDGAEGQFIWCADVQAVSSPVAYLDTVHYAPALSRAVAGCIADGLQRP